MANFEPTGLLAAAQNQRNGVSLIFSLPADSEPADGNWRLFEFKTGQDDPLTDRVLKIHSAWLFGKDRRLSGGSDEAMTFVALDHPSVSRQHALLVFRRKIAGKLAPYLLDLGSSNGTFLNGEKLISGKLTEILDKDVFKLGESSREWVLLVSK